MVKPLRMERNGEPVIYYRGRQHTIDSLFELVLILEDQSTLPTDHARLKELYEQQQEIIEAYQKDHASQA